MTESSVNSTSSKHECIQPPAGGRTTFSPPAKIPKGVRETLKPLSSNIDTFVLSFEIVWKNKFFFSILEEAKEYAKLKKLELSIPFIINEEKDEYYFAVKPHGLKGYEWILNNAEYSILVGNWEKPKTRPSCIVTLRSETLWRKGPRFSVRFITKFFETVGAKIQSMKISRLDLCVDTLFPLHLWSPDLLDNVVTRACDRKLFFKNGELTGISIGKGAISARLYDKEFEINQKSKKNWFFDIWGFSATPPAMKVIRVEFQLRRDAVKEIGLYRVDDAFTLVQNIWGYCTEKWLKFQSNPGKQSKQRDTLPWWSTIQNGFNNIPCGTPLIRNKALNADKSRLAQQIVGLMSSFAALEVECQDNFQFNDINLISTFKAIRRHLIINDLNDIPFRERVYNKKAKYQRLSNKYIESQLMREKLGFLPKSLPEVS